MLTAGCSESVCKSVNKIERTVEDVLNDRITYARKQVEQFCIIKAKAEAAGLLKYPHEFINSIAGLY